jgi:hypothetical protein
MTPLVPALFLLACALGFADEPVEAPTYFGEVGRILSAKCIGCHRAGQPGPIPLDTWEQARLFAREIRLVVGMRKMPPWPAVPGYGHFSNDRSLTVAEIETLIRWTDTGTQKGNGGGRLTPSLSTRDAKEAAITLAAAAAYEVPANGDVEARCFYYPGLRTDAWIQGIDVIPGDGRLVLDVRVFADVDSTAGRMDEADPAPGFRCTDDPSGYLKRPRLGDWSSGMPLQRTPSHAGRQLRAGTPILVEIRYAPIGTPVKDRTRIRLLIMGEPPPRVLRTRFVASEPLTIPADTWSFRSSTIWTAPHDFTLHAIAPYMSELGTDFKASVVLPDGRENPLVWVHDYDVGWQISYVLREPLLIRSGTRIKIQTEFDNFETNPRARKGEPAKGRYGLALEYDEPRTSKERT